MVYIHLFELWVWDLGMGAHGMEVHNFGLRPQHWLQHLKFSALRFRTIFSCYLICLWIGVRSIRLEALISQGPGLFTSWVRGRIYVWGLWFMN